MKRILQMLITAGFVGLTATTAFAAGTLYFGLSGEPSTLDTVIQPGTAGRTVKLAIHRGLVNYGIDGKISPELAESYDISPDAKEFTFHLRQTTFHDGSSVTAADVKASLERIIDPAGKGAFRNELSIISKIETPDQKTVKLTLSSPSMALIDYLALPESVIVPAAWLQKNAANPTASPIGAGPFMFESWTRGREIVVKKFPGYYKQGKPDLDEVHYVFYSDENTRVNALKSGDVDIIEYVPAKDAADLEKGPGTELLRNTGPFMGLQFNTKFEPFSKPEVRQAIAYAVDRSVIINTAFNGLGEPIYGLAIPKGYMGYSEAKANYFKHDVEKAKALLAKAGYPNGFNVKLLASSQYSFHQNTAIAIQSELAKVGIKVTLDLPDWASRMAKATAGDYDFTVLGSLGEITDADWLSNYYYGGDKLVRTNNSPYFNDPQINELLDKGRATVDTTERAKIYDAFADRALELSPLVYFMWREQSYSIKKGVTGFTNMPGFLTFQSGISIESTKIE
ncbi:peptide ABC transporter substrate-binding protein [Agrobacterium tumefaciens]|uniref:AgaA n=3 Tax=Agrobacterium tumefaciens complex TaxID=1183400 RepID=A5WXX3_AGRTU|nr:MULTISPECIES: ABC transporter substrate-binding protein [Agrobacterium]AAZ50441.1 AgaA [Agrobacterium tumefaciens]ASK40810.1 peptide ABC transporter substrate-binding protein [Agrobacterium genomosp. 6]ASK42376.1 peptide ABC transporter substrate-binding protein [Agrobacterium sp.]KEY51321.1 peptide ABC transporter substrate-binding protein [Agrobacterium tumefaciens]NTA14199.1 peptide ABC transporter substrate-binding protein [Agrobacterium tumefaciens]